MNIGVFDSGLGGLAILKKFYEELPEYDYIYLADNEHVPFGGKSPELIYRYTAAAVDFLFKQDCVLVILACNAATTNALRRIQQEFLPQKYPDRRVIGIVKPVVEVAAASKAKKVGIIGTYATVVTDSFPKELHKLNSKLQIHQQACPLLVPIIEEGEIAWSGLDSILTKYLSPLASRGVEEIILACTHYELIADKIQQMAGKNIRVIPQGKITAMKLADYLRRHKEIEKNLAKNRQRTYYVTDANPRFKHMTQFFLNGYWKKTDKLNHIMLAA